MTHTYAILDISESAYAEIRAKLEAAGYSHAIHEAVIDMHGIGLRAGDGVAETERLHSAKCREQEAQRAREAEALQAGFELGRQSAAPGDVR